MNERYDDRLSMGHSKRDLKGLLGIISDGINWSRVELPPRLLDVDAQQGSELVAADKLDVRDGVLD